MKNKIGILFTSRNNYELLENWYKKVDTKNYFILNIDEDSTEEQKKMGKEICDKYGITYMDREERGMHFNLLTASNVFEKKGLEWIMYFSHDCYPKTENFFIKLDSYLTEHDLNNFGAVGFNILHDWHDIQDWDGDNTPLRTVARTPLEPGDMYYRHYKYWPNTRVRYDEKFNKPFAVESIMWTAGLLNVNQYKSHIKPTAEYQMFHSWDDICFQFLYKNIYNIVLPQFCLAHDQDSKVKYGVPKSSPNVDETTKKHFYGVSNHLEVWKNRWGFSWDYPDSINEFQLVRKNYKGTLIEKFSEHDPLNGPLKSFDFNKIGSN
tara:strand:- start:9566 stop:10528 length:963 start_codon:yes stop_codon:yes gene_type:complete